MWSGTATAAKRVPVFVLVVLSAALWSALRAMDNLMSMVQQSGQSSGGVEAIASGLPIGLVERTTDLLQAWAATSTETRSLLNGAMGAYFWVDLLFCVAYLMLLWAVWRKVRPVEGGQTSPSPLFALVKSVRWWLLVPIGLADLFENSARWCLFTLVDVPEKVPPGWLVWLSWIFTVLKFGLLLLVVAALVEGARVKVPWSQWRRGIGRGLWRLRVGVAGVVLFTALMLLEQTGQALDLVRTWSQGWQGAEAAAAAVGGAALLGLAAWFAARRLVLASWTRYGVKLRWWWLVGTGVALSAAAFCWGWTQLAGPGLVIGVVGVLGLLWDTFASPGLSTWEVIARQSQAADAGAPGDDLRGRTTELARGLAVTPVVALGLAAVTAFTPAVLVMRYGGREDVLVLFLATCATTVATPMAAWVLVSWLRRIDQPLTVPDRDDPPLTWWARMLLAGLALLVVGVQLTAIVGDSAPVVSALVVVALFLASVVFLLSEAQRWAERTPVPSGLLFFGFSRIPVVVLLTVALAVSSFGPLNDGSSHDVRHNDTAVPAGVDVETLWTRWRADNCLDEQTGKVPLVLVASHGGGQRAAYWTASALTDLFGTDLGPCKRSSAVFALGGASGGSFGSTAWLTALGESDQKWYETLGKQDFLTDPIAWMLTADLARAYTGFKGEDRASRLEKRFENGQPGLGEDYFADQRGSGGLGPSLVFNGTQVETGCRLNVSDVRLAGSAHACNDFGNGGTAPATSDLLDYLCARDGGPAGSMNRSTGALLSARFPYVSPSGNLYRCDTGDRIAVVDGGYSDNTGVDGVLSLWHELEGHVAKHNARGKTQVVPVFVMIDNHYRTQAEAKPASRTQELFVPTNTKDLPDELDDVIAEQRARAAFSGKLPGVEEKCPLGGTADRFFTLHPVVSPGLQAPTAWTLSQLAVEDLDRQRGKALEQPAPTALKSWVGGTVDCSGGGN